MSFYIVLSEEDSLYFSFDEKRLYKNGMPKKELLDQEIPFEIFKYLVECSPNKVTHDEIINEVWKKRVGKKNSKNQIDGNNLSKNIGAIRKYLGDEKPYKYIETSSKAYKCNFERVFADSDYFELQINELNTHKDELVEKMEQLQKKIDEARDGQWKKIYADQLKSAFDCYERTKKKLDKFIGGFETFHLRKQSPPDIDTKNDEKILFSDPVKLLKAVASHQNEIKQALATANSLFVTYCDDEIFLNSNENSKK